MESSVTADASTTPIVLVHGWAGSAEAWDPIVSRLRAKARGPVVAVRLPGSPGAPDGGTATIPGAASMLAETLRAQVGPVLLVGHSMGAQVTLLAHAMESESVLGEVVIDPAYGASDTDHSGMVEWASLIETQGHAAVYDFFASAAPTLPPATGDLLLADLSATHPAVIARYLRSEYLDSEAIGFLAATQRAAALRTKPVLAIHSTELGASRERMLPAPPGSRVETWSGHGHFLHLEAPDRFVDTVDAWHRSLTTVVE
ncbi:alpha/beta fold hydrolase [Agromyces albus]|uniref:alpha/beta fold hydrolase n=1 Tax=Agromyces albus TaxID=205332 RepID=UPI002787DA98|nr:alpha/beta hydrolase [Agromyces albus]MDQ0574341.1 pimeloyl-ACP methyl ester carboxylesterase [Agromyces albus]